MSTRINLTLPRHWNQCSTEQLELIADVMREQVERADRYRPFSMQNVKIAMFFALAGLEIVEGPNPRVPVEEQYYTCRMKTPHTGTVPKCVKALFGNALWNRPRVRREETFSLYLWQINYWLSPKTPPKDEKGREQSAEVREITKGAGMLDWLDNENGVFLTKFPYAEVKRKKSRWKTIGHGDTFRGPMNDLDGFSWAQYRMATDAMQSYMKLSNSLIKMRQMRSFSDEQMRQQAQNVDLAKAMFLATIFIAKTKFVDTNTGIIKRDFHYESNQITDNAEYFRNYPETQFQVVLFWWTGIMHSLSKRYPHVFKVQKVDKKQQEKSPLDIYSATIATMQKYVGLDENQCNNQSYSLVLEQLERMSKENEEMEKIRRKK